MSKYELDLFKLTDDVSRVPTYEVLSMYLTLRKASGSNYECLCPFHNDNGLGNFKVNSELFKCFACGEGGNSIFFVQKYFGLNFVDALMKLALDLNLINQVQYSNFMDRYQKSKNKKDFKPRRVNKRIKKSDDEKLSKLKSDEEISIVYEKLMTYAKLSEEHREHLKDKRYLTDKEIEENEFFSLPMSDEDVLNFMSSIDNPEDELLGVPGFYLEGGKVQLTKTVGLAFPIKNSKGLVVGIQIRKFNNSRAKYVWLTSSFANGLDDSKHLTKGVGNKIRIDITYPEVVKNKSIIITEGKFKALKVAKEVGSIVISVQGVSSWKGVNEEIYNINDQILAKFGKTIDNVFMAFDADMLVNKAVFKQSKKLTKYLNDLDGLQNASIYYLVWNPEEGKGIDDVMNNKGVKSISKFKYDLAEETIAAFFKNEKKDESDFNDFLKLLQEYDKAS